MTDYGKQLREKQKAKRIYGMSEQQFRNYYEKATAMKGDSGENLVRMLEMRLDNAVYRAGLARTRPAARQAVSHAQFQVNGRKVDVASCQVKPGDVISVRENKQQKGLWKSFTENAQVVKEPPSWITTNAKTLEAKVTSRPAGEELKQLFNPKLIIEFYSR